MNQGASMPEQNAKQQSLQFQQFVNLIQNQNINGEIAKTQNCQAQGFLKDNKINAQNFGQNQILQSTKDQKNYVSNNTQQSPNVAQPFVKQNLELGINNQAIFNKLNQENNQNNVNKQVDKNQKMTQVSFNVKCGQTKVGERVAVVGGIEELGNWDPEQAIFLETSSEQFPNWHVTQMLPRNKTIEYKYLIIQFEAFPAKNQVQSIQSLQASSNIFKAQILSITWEQLGSQLTNRRLNTIDKKEIILNEEINNKVVIEEYLEEKSKKFDWKKDQNSKDKVDDATPKQLFSFSVDANNIKVQDNFGQQNAPQTQLFSNQNSNIKNTQVNQNLLFNLQDENKQTLQANSQIQSSQEQNIFKKQPNSLVNQQVKQNNLTIIKPQSSLQISQSAYKKNESPTLKKPFKNYLQATKEKEEGDTSRSARESEQRLKEIPKPKVLDYENTKKRAKFVLETEDTFRKKEISIDPLEPIIMASFLLPYTIQRDEKSGTLTIQNCFHNPTIMYGTLESMIQKKQINFKWVGLVTTLEDVTDQEKLVLTAQFKEKGAYPIFMTAEETLPFLLFYENNIRPLFHNFKDLYNMQNESVKYWSSYVALNQKFANKIIEVKNELTMQVKQIFIHNNHLLMVPAQVKKQFEDANIGLYFHSPFPSSAHFRMAKFRFEILKSLLHCDLVGFHLFIYARNFIKTVQRLCGFELELLSGGYFGIDFHGKKVLIRVAHVGIDQSFIEDLTKTKLFKSQQVSFNNAIQRHIMAAKSQKPLQNSNGEPSLNDKPIIICSIDSYHPMAGLKHKLLSYKLFLQRYPNYRNRIVLIQFVGSIVQAFDFAQDHQKQLLLIKEMRNEVIKIRDEIHKQFGYGCLVFSESNPPLEKRLSLWAKSNIILVSALKDGLCIQLLEYVVCRKLAGKFSESCMICSEFAGCSEAMKGVYMFNPFSITDFPEQLDIAISQSPEINEENMNLAYQYVCRNSMTSWTFEFLKDLKYAYQPAKATFYLGLNLNSQASKGLNLGVTLKSDFKRLNIDACYNSLVKAKKSVIIIEIEAMPHHKFSQNSLPTVEVIEQLYSIMNDNRNIVLIISNHTQQTLEDLFLKGRSAGVNGNHFWLAAESGYLFKTGGSNLNRGSEWQKQTQLGDLSWMQKVKNIMSEFEKNIDGSFIEQRQSCILWNYKNADKEQSMLFIHDLYNQIQKALVGEPIEMIQGNGYLEVKPTAVNKQTLIKLLLKTVVKNSKVDFIFYLGNSSEDEIVFEYLKSESAKNQYFSTHCAKFLCVLEKKPSEADYYLGDLDAVRPLLSKLQTATQHRKKNRSYADLTQVSNNLGPISTRKLGNLNQSIANLNQYMNSSIDSNVSLQGPQSSSFIPMLFGQKNVSEMPYIEEESDDSHECQQIYQINQSQNHKKSFSLDDTTKINYDNILLKDNENFKLETSQNSEQPGQNKVVIISLQDSSSPPIETINSHLLMNKNNEEIVTNENTQINVSFNSQSNFDTHISYDDNNQKPQTIFATKIFQDQDIKKIQIIQSDQFLSQEYIEKMQLLNKLPQSVMEINTSNFQSPNKSDFCANITQPLSAGNQLKVAHTQSTNALYGGQQQGVPKLDFSKMVQQNMKQPSESFSDLHQQKGHHGSQGDMIEAKTTTNNYKKIDQTLLAPISGAVSMNSKNSKIKFQNQLKVDKFDVGDQEIDDIDGDEESIKDDSIGDLKAQYLSSNSPKREQE